jgi:periplasmic mercuric ion binding protein
MKSRLAKLASIFALGLLLAGTALAADQTAKFKVTGMYCDACQTKIQHALNKTDGVKSATVDLNSGSATVTFDDAKVKPQQIIKIIEKEGYKAEVQKKS